ncbi:MAG TPA: hypothetical protein VKE96_12395 [Vicinamibacterales bacterium]|nr:hypothetical protein [Vicinamibacterales bacterium]
MTPDEIKKTIEDILDAHDAGVEEFQRASEEWTRANNQVRKAKSLLDDAEYELTAIQRRQNAGLDKVLAANRAALRLMRGTE